VEENTLPSVRLSTPAPSPSVCVGEAPVSLPPSLPSPPPPVPGPWAAKGCGEPNATEEGGGEVEVAKGGGG